MAALASSTFVVVPFVFVAISHRRRGPSSEEERVGFAADLISHRLVLALGCVILAVTDGRRHLALVAEGTGGALGLSQPHFEELVAKPASPSGRRLHDGPRPVLGPGQCEVGVAEHLVRCHVQRRECGPAHRGEPLPRAASGVAFSFVVVVPDNVLPPSGPR